MGRLDILKKYNEVTEPARRAFQQTRREENQAFLEAVGTSLAYAEVEELLKHRDIVMRKAEKEKAAESVRLWKEYKRRPKPAP